MQENSTPKRLYAIEFLRIFFVFFIILGHCMNRYPEVKDYFQHLFNTTYMNTYFGVEFFFIIGGFFLYKQMQKSPSVTSLIKKIYFRLLPALVFVFVVCLLCHTVNLNDFPSIFALTTGLKLPGEVMGWGDWYVGCYFWASCLFIGLFMTCRNVAFLWTFVLMYFTLCLKFNVPYQGWMKTYYTVIGTEFVRAIYSIGLGITASYIAQRVELKRNAFTKSVFTALEIIGFVCVFYYVARSSHCHFNFWNMEIVFAMLLISISKSLGFTSLMLNNIAKIQYISRYTYPIFLSHAIFIKQLLAHNDYGLSNTTCTLIVGGGLSLVE